MKKIAEIASLLLMGSVAAMAGVPAPTPEPATIGLIGTGLAGVGLVAWLRGRRK